MVNNNNNNSNVALPAGTMLFGESTSYDTASRLMDECMEHGVNFFDSAEMYPVPQSAETQGASEKMLGRWMKARARCPVAARVMPL